MDVSIDVNGKSIRSYNSTVLNKDDRLHVLGG